MLSTQQMQAIKLVTHKYTILSCLQQVHKLDDCTHNLSLILSLLCDNNYAPHLLDKIQFVENTSVKNAEHKSLIYLSQFCYAYMFDPHGPLLKRPLPGFADYDDKPINYLSLAPFIASQTTTSTLSAFSKYEPFVFPERIGSVGYSIKEAPCIKALVGSGELNVRTYVTSMDDVNGFAGRVVFNAGGYFVDMNEFIVAFVPELMSMVVYKDYGKRFIY